jgi:hypothetical protein
VATTQKCQNFACLKNQKILKNDLLNFFIISGLSRRVTRTRLHIGTKSGGNPCTHDRMAPLDARDTCRIAGQSRLRAKGPITPGGDRMGVCFLLIERSNARAITYQKLSLWFWTKDMRKPALNAKKVHFSHFPV